MRQVDLRRLTDLAYEGEDTKAGHLDQGNRAGAHPAGKLSGVARLGRLSQEGGQAADEAAAKHDRTAQNFHLAQNFVHLMQCLHRAALHKCPASPQPCQS